MKLAFLTTNQVLSEINTPTVEQVHETIGMLGNQVLFLHLHGTNGTLTLLYADNDRFVVTYHGVVNKGTESAHSQSGRLLDPSLTEADGFIRVTADPEIDEDYLYRTVERAFAKSVADYFYNNESLPRDLVWDGYME